MKALSLWQPWASLVAIGAKQIETRSWPAPERLLGQRIAIHAAKRWTRAEHDITRKEPFRSMLARANLYPWLAYRIQPVPLPFGAIIATAEIAYCLPSDRFHSVPGQIGGWIHSADHFYISLWEAAFGNYEPGRYGWALRNVQPLPEPVSCCGAQGFFEVSL